MLAPFTRRRQRSSSAYTPLLWLLAAAFMLRALLPTGYMPDYNALKRGDLAIAFCPANGTLTAIPLDGKLTAKPLDGKLTAMHLDGAPTAIPLDGTLPAHGPDGDATYAHCPFGALKQLALIGPPAPSNSATPVVLPFALAALKPEYIPLQVAGPPLGSQAPPPENTTLLA